MEPKRTRYKAARTQLEEAQKAIQQGDWEKFGKAMEVLKRLLTEPPR